VTSGSTIKLSDSTITTTGTGANDAFATGGGSSVNLTNVTNNATADGGHAVMATQGGTMTLTNVNMKTAGGSFSRCHRPRRGYDHRNRRDHHNLRDELGWDLLDR